MALTAALVFSSLLSSRVLAWGPDGHRTVGFVAMEFLSPRALQFVQQTLGPDYNMSLGTAATWADDVRNKPDWLWSKKLHFIDAEDEPLAGQCSVELERDCADSACIVTAIANYTERLMDKTLPESETQIALKFLGAYRCRTYIDRASDCSADHFMGDLAQPLHTEGIAAGGNRIPVTCAGQSTNLHHLWDDNMLGAHLESNFNNSVHVYSESLVERIRSDTLRVPVHQWLACLNGSELPAATSQVPLGQDDRKLDRSNKKHLCPLEWAREANAYSCTTIFAYAPGTDLCNATQSDYMETATTIIDTQIARAGFRLAAWLNELLGK